MDEENRVAELPTSRIYWHDADHNILVHEATGRWSWDEAHQSLRIVNETVFANARPTCTVHWMHQYTTLPPGNALANLRRLMVADPPNEELVIIVGASSMLMAFLRTVLRAYGMAGAISKYHYVEAFPDALHIIEEHRRIAHPT
ncbi:MAG: hypothetical protein IT323_14210 [Anaerolineae bacterium]|nr:hypothetical protein [Anaerolineae bacterium]